MKFKEWQNMGNKKVRTLKREKLLLSFMYWVLFEIKHDILGIRYILMVKGDPLIQKNYKMVKKPFRWNWTKW